MYGTVITVKVFLLQSNTTCGPFGDPDLNSHTHTHAQFLRQSGKSECGLDVGY